MSEEWCWMEGGGERNWGSERKGATWKRVREGERERGMDKVMKREPQGYREIWRGEGGRAREGGKDWASRSSAGLPLLEIFMQYK